MIDEQDPETNVAVGMAIAVAIFVSIFTIATALTITGSLNTNEAGSNASSPSPATVVGSVLAPVPAAEPSSGVSTAASAPVVLLFESAKSELPSDAILQLRPLIQDAKTGGTLIVSGFHDSSGDPTRNAELAKLRAFAVRDGLIALGISSERVELSKPQETLGGTDPALSRRVEVSIRK